MTEIDYVTFAFGHENPVKYTIEMRNLKPCNGTVVDEAGKPIPGAVVRPIDIWDSTSLDKIVKLPSAVTDSKGAYALPPSPVRYDRYYFEVQKDGYVQQERPGNNSDSKRIIMVRAGGVTGRVVDERGRPVAKAKMLANYKEAITDQDGRFTINNLKPGMTVVDLDSRYTRLIAKSINNVLIEKNKITDVGDIVASPGVKVSRKLVDVSTGKTYKDIIYASPLSFDSKYGSFEEFHNDDYNLRLLPGETYRIYISTFQSIFTADESRIEVKVPKEGIKDLKIKVRKMTTGEGIILDDHGKPIRSALVIAQGFVAISAQGPYCGLSITDKQGHFTIPLSRHKNTPDKVQLVIIDAAKQTSFTYPVDFDDLIKGNVTLKLKPTLSLRVSVKDKATGAPVKGAYVYYGNCEMKTNAAGEAIFQTNTRTGNCSVDVFKSYGLMHSKASIMLPDPKSKSWNDSVTVHIQAPRESPHNTGSI